MTSQQADAQTTRSIMTIAVARRVLRGPLRFADEEQIRAADLLELLEEAFRLGMVVRNGRAEVECAECSGSGSTWTGTCPDCCGFGTDEVELGMIDKEVLTVLIKRLERRKRP